MSILIWKIRGEFINENKNFINCDSYDDYNKSCQSFSFQRVTGAVVPAGTSNTTRILQADENYTYAVTPEDDVWSTLDSVEEKVAVCRIPDNILVDMTDEQLLQAVLDYPLIYDIFVYDDIETGVRNIEDICDAYAELLQRDTALDTLMASVHERKEFGIPVTAEEEIENDIVASLVLFQDEFQNKLTMEEMEDVASLSCMIDVNDVYEVEEDASLYPLSTGITTPNGTKVAYLTRTCIHLSSTYHQTLDADIVSEYGVTLISTGSCKYNCHSYAWYSQSESNKYWINDPSAYMTDGSYTKVFSGTTSTSSINAAKGDIVFYGSTSDLSSTHSAILTSSASGSPMATRTAKSKWGICGVFSHTITNVPSAYDRSIITAWS